MSEVSAESIAQTQKSLGKYVKKPVLTEKLLKKPPFRFLHDVIKAVIKETGFLRGLFSENELNSDNVKDKEAKVAFLTKLIEAVKSVSKSELKVRPSKIVAGLEAGETNVLLQTIAKCIDKKIDSKEYVAKTKAVKDKVSGTKKSRDTSVTRSKKKEVTPKTSSDRKAVKTPKGEDTKTAKSKKEESPRTDTKKPPENEEIKPEVEEEKRIEPEPKQQEEHVFSNARQSSAGLVRPKSARPKSGDRTLLKNTPSAAEPNKVLKATPPPISLRPPSVRPSSARPGAPRLRPDSALPVSEPVAMGNIKVIVENFGDGTLEDAEQDTVVVIQNAPEEAAAEPLLEGGGGNNKGQLVEQILEQIQQQGDGGKKRVEIDWQQDGLRGKDATAKEVTHLRTLIQSLTKTANPLGKLMNYLHEDLEAMQSELEMWTRSKKQLYGEIDKQKKSAVESSKPLMERLEKLRDEIKKQEQEILLVRGNILKNEVRISELIN